jgi:hypothetical protein
MGGGRVCSCVKIINMWILMMSLSSYEADKDSCHCRYILAMRMLYILTVVAKSENTPIA